MNEYNNLLELAKKPTDEPIGEEILNHAAMQPPFVPLHSALNMRDLGFIPDSPIPPGKLFRSGALHVLTPEDRATLRNTYGIKKIFDLRFDHDREKDPAPTIDGIETIWLPRAVDPHPTNITDFVGDGIIPAFVKMYDDILRVQVNAYRAAMLELRDNPDATILFHCTAGKDRTGVLAALLLSLVECPIQRIGEDYNLTRIGTEKEREFLVKSLLAWFGEDWIKRPGPKELGSTSPEIMITFVKHLDAEYGGTAGYIHNVLGLPVGSAEKIKANILKK